MKSGKLIVALISLVIVITAFISGYQIGRFSKFDDITLKVKNLREVIAENYYGDVNEQSMKQTTATGLVSCLDPYSSYFTAEEYSKFKQDISGTYAGIGIVIDATKAGEFIVQRVFEDSPAYENGLKVGDRLIAINGEDIENLSVDKVVGKVRGEPDTKLSVTVVRKQQKMTFSLVRKDIKVKQIVGKTYDFQGKKVAYIRVQEFTKNVSKDFAAELDTLQADNPVGLVLDLRFNPGGLLEEAVAMADLFLENGTIVTTQTKRESVPRTAKSGDKYEKIPLVLLVNEYSASASEILSGALQDNNRAKLVGKKTYGKASIQSTFEFSEGDAVKLTIGKYLTPNGRYISSTKEKSGGIEPDTVCEISDDEFQKVASIWRTAPEPDTQLKKALEVLIQQTQPK